MIFISLKNDVCFRFKRNSDPHKSAIHEKLLLLVLRIWIRNTGYNKFLNFALAFKIGSGPDSQLWQTTLYCTVHHNYKPLLTR
jgi:hypothetical protein